jgi:hypothetical protein
MDGKVLDSNVTFETVTPYRPETDGVHTVTLTDVGAPHTVLRDRVTVTTGSGVTVGAIQSSKGIELRSFTDDLQAGPAGNARVRVINTAPDTPRLKVALDSQPTPRGPPARRPSPRPSSASGHRLRTRTSPPGPTRWRSRPLDCTCGLYLNDPTAWLPNTPTTNARHQ